MGDGQAWPLAAYVPALGPVWDRLYDDNLIRGVYGPDDVRLAASRLLLENFDLAPEAVATLIIGADLAELVKAVESALFGPERSYHSWSDWVLGSLYANGIDPASVPPDRLHAVLGMLVASGRAIPSGKYISSAVAGARLASIRAIAVPANPPAPPPAESAS